MRYPMGTHWGPLGIKAKKICERIYEQICGKIGGKIDGRIDEDSPLLGFPKGVGGWTPKYVICSVLLVIFWRQNQRQPTDNNRVNNRQSASGSFTGGFKLSCNSSSRGTTDKVSFYKVDPSFFSARFEDFFSKP